MLPTRLTRESFSDFGDVIEISEKAEHFTINDGYTERYHDLAQVDVMAKGGRTLINIFRSSPLDKPLAIKMMERHPLSSQAFMPLGDEDYLVVVAPAGDFDSSKIKVFLASSKQGVNYHPGTWHHYCLAVNNTSDFMVIDRGGDGENCDAITLDGSLVIEI
ncbi:MAG: ureidoglycolate lyase [Gammaproteobacteria bacterium]|nr:MAG: ureidoglycolate lyase [Gammaproteobacteria bacterium]